MIYSIFPAKDSVCYDKDILIYQNTGLDEVLELKKELSSSVNATTANSRILMKFDIADINEIVSQCNSSPTYYLSLYTTDVKEIPLSYTVEVAAVSQSWEMGVGKTADSPITTDGVSWTYRDRLDGTSWLTSSFANGSTGSFSSYPGGGTWYTASIATQSFEFQSTDLRVNVTNIVNNWLSGSFSNDGFLIRRTTDEEQNNSNMGALQFFSRDTHTIYPPKLEIAWDDSSYVTASLVEITSSDSFLIYSPNLESSYNENAKAKIRIVGRLKYPTRTYSTQSAYTTVTHRLPTSSYYSIIDATSQDTIIPYDTSCTKLSCDAYGNYFKLWMNTFQPERVYRLLVKVVTSETEEIFNDFIFKVTR